MAPKEKQIKDKIIYSKITALQEFQDSKIIFTYVSTDCEVDTKNLIRHALKLDKEVFVPKINLKKKELEVYKILSLKELKEGIYNILEPYTGKSRRKNFDIILVPGLGFDKKKNRIGKGGGYFDKFLKNTKGLNVGLCYKEQLFDSIPTLQHDIKMDILISD